MNWNEESLIKCNQTDLGWDENYYNLSESVELNWNKCNLTDNETT